MGKGPVIDHDQVLPIQSPRCHKKTPREANCDMNLCQGHQQNYNFFVLLIMLSIILTFTYSIGHRIVKFLMKPASCISQQESWPLLLIKQKYSWPECITSSIILNCWRLPLSQYFILSHQSEQWPKAKSSGIRMTEAIPVQAGSPYCCFVVTVNLLLNHRKSRQMALQDQWVGKTSSNLLFLWGNNRTPTYARPISCPPWASSSWFHTESWTKTN